MSRAEAIQVERDVDVAGTQLPAEIRRGPVSELRAAISELVGAMVGRVCDGHALSRVVSFESEMRVGTVGHANVREWLKSLADAVRQVIATCVDAHATRTGTWEPRITARLRSRDKGGRSEGAHGHWSVRYRIGFGWLWRLSSGWPLLQSYAGKAMQIMGERSRDACHQN